MTQFFSPILYNKRAQEHFGLKTRPQPWLHLAFKVISSENGKNYYYYAIYVWDTREVVDAGIKTLEFNKVSELFDCLTTKSLNKDTSIMIKAFDNNKQLHTSVKKLEKHVFEVNTGIFQAIKGNK